MSNIIEIGGGGSGSAVLIPKTITANGVYSASSDSADGYNEVTVNVENGGFIPVSLDNETHIIETNRTITITDNVITSSISSDTYCTGIITIPISAFNKNEFIMSYDLGSPTYTNSQYYARAFFSNTIPDNAWKAEAEYGHIKLVQDTTARTGLMQKIEIPIGANYFNIEFGVSNFASIELWEKVEAPIETWIINSKSATIHPTTTAHFVYNNGLLTGYDVADNAGNETVTMGDISTFIGDASSFNWWVTANANMTYRLFDVINGTLGTLQTATIGTKIISDGTIADPYCIEIRRYS